MAPSRPPMTGYARISQAEEFSDDSDNDDMAASAATLQPASAPRYTSITQPRPKGGMFSDGHNTPTLGTRSRTRRRMRSNSSGVDIKAINARLERWADEIASKFKIGKIKGKTGEEERLEIHYSVFQAPEGITPANAETLAHDGNGGRMTKDEFEAVVESVRIAIEQGIHPKMISQGSSGSYFARNSEGRTVGVFKPKDEEPYAAGNPKWNKWIHRNLFPCCFGRACLIPNLSYVSEAAAYTLDCRLRTNLVPYTDIVHLSSKSFHYDYFARRNFYRKKKPFAPKAGSFQVFLQGFSDANIFLRKYPWPDHLSHSFRHGDVSSQKRKRWSDTCRSGEERSDDEDDDGAASTEDSQAQRFVWTAALQQSFREELEKLVILDYIMRNTDRGLDNWMIKVDWESQAVSIASEPPKMNGIRDDDDDDEDDDQLVGPRPVSRKENNGTADMSQEYPYRHQRPMSSKTRARAGPVMTVGAIDNSLSWPWKHPDAWRSFPFGWLFLPVSLIGQPFSQKTRDHFLPLLTSKQWWSETQLALRKVFSQDVDFQERMFARQIAVMKGQAWNVVETLKTADHGPLELTRRARVCVWDDLVSIPVAVPLRAPSAEMRRRREAESNQAAQDEMDISAVNASASQFDLLGLGIPPTDLPNPHRFELSNPASPRTSEDCGGPTSPGSAATGAGTKNVTFLERPVYGSSPKPQSYTGPLATTSSPHAPRQARRLSASLRPRGGSNSQTLYGSDDLEGDLGYAAAEDMEGNQRKVIVERLETVKSKNPVFTWC
ncbi:MAG: phosphatidyl inositol kinase [Claussenomyces sp. TS43310]|nr:MAG: phosphatidyl inositol kinase [Claussenomyces sp. TS43310]